MKQATIKIQNLKCGGCAHTISSKIEAIQGIFNVEVDIDNSEVQFQTVSTSNIFEVEHKLKKMGYPRDGDKNSGLNKAMSYVSCAIGKSKIKKN